MVRLTFWLQLLLVVLIMRQSAAVSDQCSELQEEISRLERDIMSIRDLKHENELRADNCHGNLTKQFNISQAAASKLKQSEAVISGLKKKLEVKEEVLKSNTETQTQLQTDIDGLTKTVQSMNQMVQRLCDTPEHVCRYLFDAAKSDNVNTAKILFKCSNDNCTKEDRNRNTPLIYAAGYGHVKVVRVLLEGGANVDRANVAYTALHHAALNGRQDVCRLLLDWGANVDIPDNWQNTALHWAAWNGHLSVVKLLVEGGADVRVKNVRGQTASDMARFKGRRNVAEWLDTVRRS